MKRLACLVALCAVPLAGAQVPENFSDLSPGAQERLLDVLAPSLMDACTNGDAALSFEDQLARVKAAESCLASTFADADMVTFVRDETTHRCVEWLKDGLRRSHGHVLRISIPAADYGRLLDGVLDQLRAVACAKPGVR